MPTPRSNGTRRTRSSTKKDMDAIRGGLLTAEPEDDKSKAARRARKTKVEQDVAELTEEKIASSIAKVSVDLGKHLNTLGDVTRQKAEEYRTLCEAVEMKKAELEELHGKDISQFAIDDLVAEHDEKKEEFEQEIAEAKANWEREQEEHEQAIAERDAALNRNRQQEADDFNYKLKINRRNEQDQFEQQKRERDRQRQDEEEKFNAACSAKKKELDEYAGELNKRTEEVIAREAEVEAKVTEAVNAKEKSLRAEFGTKAKYAELETDKQIELLKQQIQTLQANNQNLQGQVDAKQAEIKSLQMQMTTMATKSLDVSSGRAVAEAQQEMAKSMGKK